MQTHQTHSAGDSFNSMPNTHASRSSERPASFTVKVPPTYAVGSFSYVASATYFETVAQNALWHYNSARAHDGYAPLSRMPAGTTYTSNKVQS